VRTPFNIQDFDSIRLPSEPMVAAALHNLQGDCLKDSVEIADLAGKPLIIYRRFEKLIMETYQK
jgi:hypothetical protein